MPNNTLPDNSYDNYTVFRTRTLSRSYNNSLSTIYTVRSAKFIPNHHQFINQNHDKATDLVGKPFTTFVASNDPLYPNSINRNPIRTTTPYSKIFNNYSTFNQLSDTFIPADRLLVGQSKTSAASLDEKHYGSGALVGDGDSFYKSYDPRKGLHIAALLGGFMVLVLIVLMYKDKRKFVAYLRRRLFNAKNDRIQEEKLISAWLCYNWFLGGRPSGSKQINGLSNSDIHNILCSRLLKQQAQGLKVKAKTSKSFRKRLKVGKTVAKTPNDQLITANAKSSSFDWPHSRLTTPLKRGVSVKLPKLHTLTTAQNSLAVGSIRGGTPSSTSNQTYSQIMRAGLGAAMVPICPSLTRIHNPAATTQLMANAHVLSDASLYSPIFYPGHNSLKSDDEDEEDEKDVLLCTANKHLDNRKHMNNINVNNNIK